MSQVSVSAMALLRLYADDDGDTHFGTTDVALPLQDFAPPAIPFNVSGGQPATRSNRWYERWRPEPGRALPAFPSSTMVLPAERAGRSLVDSTTECASAGSNSAAALVSITRATR